MSEPKKRVINDCKHTLESMDKWVDEGACPICLTAEAGMLHEQVYSYADEAHRLCDSLRCYDGTDIPQSDANDAFALLRRIEKDAHLQPMDTLTAREAAAAAKEAT